MGGFSRLRLPALRPPRSRAIALSECLGYFLVALKVRGAVLCPICGEFAIFR